MKSSRRISQCNASFLDMFETRTKALRVFWTNHTSISQSLQSVESGLLFDRNPCISRFNHNVGTSHNHFLLLPKVTMNGFASGDADDAFANVPVLPSENTTQTNSHCHWTLRARIGMEECGQLIRRYTSIFALTSASNENSLDSSYSH